MERDIITLGVAVSAIILLVGTAGSLMPKIVRFAFQGGPAPDMMLTNAVLLNIALLIFGWRRYSDLHHEMAERKVAENHARELAERDPLTHCLNRRSGLPALRAACEKAAIQGRDLAVLMLDLDNFKQINDVRGHGLGDQVLAEIARRMAQEQGPGGVLARIGGDEFACCFPCERGDVDAVEIFATRLVDAVSQPIVIDGVSLETSVSVGIALWDNHAAEAGDSERLVHQADIAMYHAKKGGRNRFAWFRPQMEDELRFRHGLEAAMRAGIPAGEFVPYYEQQVDLETGQLAGFEMLARWHSATYGTISPEVFIPVAEDIDLIAQLSEVLIRQAFLDARDWDPRLTLSVNISPLQLRDPWFAQKLLKLLAETGFPAQRLEIEITESCLHLNLSAVRSIVTSLKNQGIRISLDDFGTGYSSLSQLRSLPFDRIKIDRSFVAELAKDGTSELINAIVALGKGLNLPVTAEGVESPEVLKALRGIGEFKGQGYLYGQPEDAATTRNGWPGWTCWLARHRLPQRTSARRADPCPLR
ncbi:MAG: EAL domain-containing protein [Croceibacterium sp.]